MGLMHLFVIFAVVIVIIALYFGDLLLYHLNNKKRKIDYDCDDKLDFSKLKLLFYERQSQKKEKTNHRLGEAIWKRYL